MAKHGWWRKIQQHYNLFGFDLDEPIFDVFTPIKQLFIAKYGIKMKDSEWNTYKLEKNFNLSELLAKTGNNPALAAQEALSHIHAPEFLARVGVNYEARFCLKILKDYQKTIHIITARDENLRSITEQSLKKHGIPHDGLHFCGRLEKPAIAEKLGIQFFVDDCPEVIEAFLNYPTRPKVLAVLDRPWNRDFKTRPSKNIYRVHGWLAPKKGMGIMSLIRKFSWL